MSKIKLNFTPAELAEKERELERQRDLQHAMATTLGERVVGSAEFKQLKRNLRGSDNTALTYSDNDVHLASLDAGEVKTLIRSSGSTSAGPFLTPESGPPAAVPARSPRVLDLVRSGEMSSDSVTFARQDTYTPVSVSTPEAASTTTGYRRNRERRLVAMAERRAALREAREATGWRGRRSQRRRAA
jgi:hypothetical protein